MALGALAEAYRHDADGHSAEAVDDLRRELSDTVTAGRGATIRGPAKWSSACVTRCAPAPPRTAATRRSPPIWTRIATRLFRRAHEI